MKKIGVICFAFVLGLALLATGCSEKKGGSLGEQLDYKITGIDPGAGLMKKTKEVMKSYGLDKWQLIEGSEAAMIASLKKAYDKKEPIVVTGWTPHWMFAKFDLKYLDDPKNVYGDAENINTVVRLGLKDDEPSAYTVLDQFAWTPKDMGEVMLMNEDGTDPAESAQKWLDNHQDKLQEWTKGAAKVNGNKIHLVYVAWASEIASTNVVAKALESIGYKVELTQVDAAPMWAGIADGSADAMVAAWLPSTHADYFNAYKGKFEDLGPNLTGTKLGLVVPSYVAANSIEDLQN